MLWFIGLVAAFILMSLSEKLWDNPVAIFGLIPVGFCFAMLGGVFLKAVGLN